MYLILTEYEVNIGNKSQVKDQGKAEVFYSAFISYTDQVRGQYYIYHDKQSVFQIPEPEPLESQFYD